MRTSTFDVIHPAFLPSTTAPPALQGAMKGGSPEAVVEDDIPKPLEFPSLDNCPKRLLLAHMEVDLAPDPVTGLMIQAGDEESVLKLN